MKTKLLSLNKISSIYLYFSFLLGFSDYQIKTKLTLEGFKRLLKVRDIKLNKSFGIFIDDIVDNQIKEYFEKELYNILKEDISIMKFIKKEKIIDNRIKLSFDEIKMIPISFLLLGERKNITAFIEDEFSKENKNKMIKLKKAVYDSGTATIPIFRGMGFSKLIINETIKNLKKNKIDGFILEVLQDNKKAKNLYIDSGFNISRKFYCYKIEKEKLEENLENILNNNKVNLQDIKIKKLGKIYTILALKEDKLIKLSRSIPSWQNSLKSVKNILDQVSILALYYNKKLIGLGCIEKINGDIKFLAVSYPQPSEIKNKDSLNFKDLIKYDEFFKTTLLKALLKETFSRKISILNVDKSSELSEFLSMVGFDNFVNQYEMYFKIQ
ncbi:MAG TPA: hypothetical protein PLF21_04805 [Exilispira sp.]|nr:hypothetical protein [Exilispira sp.]